jgi:phosphohistidine phosphatase
MKRASITSSVLVLLHHGPAVGPDVDPMRPLSTPGRAVSQRVAAAMAARGAKPDAVWHSGKLRARQTAELAWSACNPLASLTAERGLQPGDPPRWIHDRLIGEPRSIVIVGHMPSLPALLASLLGEPAGASPATFPLHGCVALERTGEEQEGERWNEVWRIEA